MANSTLPKRLIPGLAIAATATVTACGGSGGPDPAACKGVPQAQLQQLAGQAIRQAFGSLGQAFGSSTPSAPASSPADTLQTWKDSGGADVLTSLSDDLGAVRDDLSTLNSDLSANDMTSMQIDATTLNDDGQSMSAVASAALASPPPGPAAAGWNTAMHALQSVGRDAVTVASDFSSDDLTSADTDVQGMSTDLADANSAISVATQEVGS